MIVNSAKEYRTWFKTQEDRPDVDENFMGCSYETNNGKQKGFFNLFHGKKDDIERYLPSLLDIAEDNQAIYEFLQNAVDCDATHFWAFYNDKYFLAVNNGEKFSIKGLTSILNIAQSTKVTASSIGRLGIGFKLAHRLVGRGNGTHELIYENKGPIMFSWDNSSQLRSLMSTEAITCEGLDENPFLMKIAITNFPANVNECVKDIQYQDVVVFSESELEELRNYTKECLEFLFEQNVQNFSQGTLFFIKLGEGKRTLLDDDLTTLKNGIEYSMNTLKQLNSICFNGESIVKKQLLLNEYSIPKETDDFKEIDPQYKEYDILYSFGFIPMDFTVKDYYNQVGQLRKSPNFYKYFPMGDEVDNMALFVHCDSFQIEANRRKLINHHTNRELLPKIASSIIKTLSDYHNSNRSKYLQLYASILLTDKPAAQEKSWMQAVFFDLLYAEVKRCIPTEKSSSIDPSKVKIKKMNIDIPLELIGHSDKQWFFWHGDNNKEILAEAVKPEKLGVEEWNINSILVKSDKAKLNSWLASCDENIFDSFVNEIKATTTSNDAKSILPFVKLFKIGTERKSWKEIDTDANGIILTEKTNGIKSILQKVGMTCTDTAIESHPLSSLLSAPKELILYTKIKNAVEANATKLDASDKLSLVTVLNTLEGVTDSDIKKLKIFKNIIGKYNCLSKLTAFITNVESWVSSYVICREENFSEFQKYLATSEQLYRDIVGGDYNDIFDTKDSILFIYEDYKKKGLAWSSSLTIKLIEKYGSTDEILSLIEKTLDKDSVEAFVKKLDILNLFDSASYSKESFVYRIIQLCAKVGESSIRNKIVVDGIHLIEFTSSDTLSFKVRNDKENKELIYCIKLSDILPDDKQSAIYGKIVSKFSSITNYQTIFSADSSNVGNVSKRLQEKLNPAGVIVTPAQYLYILLLQAKSGISYICSPWNSLIRFNKENESPEPTIVAIINYAFLNGLSEILVKYKNISTWNHLISGKYLNSKDFTLESERAYEYLENWCGNDASRKEFLKKLDLHFEDCAEIKRRISFKENKTFAWDIDKYGMASSFLNWVATLAPIEGTNQIAVLRDLCSNNNVPNLKVDFAESDYSTAKELSSDRYLRWRKNDGIRIYTIGTEMPYRAFLDQKTVLCSDKMGDYHYFSDSKHLYVKGQTESGIASSLAQVYQDFHIPFKYEDFVSVCFDSVENQQKNKDDLDRYRQKYGDLDNTQEEDNRRAEYEKAIRDFLGQGFDMSEFQIHAEHIISRFRILNYLKSRGYTFAWDFDQRLFVKSEQYVRIKLDNGTFVNPCSGKFGLWYIHPNVWRDIVECNNWACVCTGNGESDFEIIRTREDLEQCAKRFNTVLIKMQPSRSSGIMDAIESVFPGTADSSFNIHLMMMLHNTQNKDINRLFDKVYKNDPDNYNFDN